MIVITGLAAFISAIAAIITALATRSIAHVARQQIRLSKQQYDLQQRQQKFEELRMKREIHIPSDLVVDQWVSNVESSSPRDFLLLHDLWTAFRHLLWSQIISAISMTCDFTTKSGGICFLQVCSWLNGLA